MFYHVAYTQSPLLHNIHMKLPDIFLIRTLAYTRVTDISSVQPFLRKYSDAYFHSLLQNTPLVYRIHRQFDLYVSTASHLNAPQFSLTAPNAVAASLHPYFGYLHRYAGHLFVSALPRTFCIQFLLLLATYQTDFQYQAARQSQQSNPFASTKNSPISPSGALIR